MTLVLRIENFDQLETGGPTTLTLEERSASIGRRSSMDWSLPDPSKMISGHHFDITFENGTYHLTDVSMNGTFVDGQRHRLEGRLALKGGERLIVGHYIIGVTVHRPQSAPPEPTGVTQDDPWGAFDPTGMQPVAGGRGGAGLDALNEGFVQVQRPGFGAASGGGGMKTETSLQLPMGGRAPAPPSGGLQTPTSWGAPLPPTSVSQPPQPAVPYTPNLGQEPEAPRGPLPEASRPAPQPRPQPPMPETMPEPAYTPSLGQDSADALPYQPSLGQDAPYTPSFIEPEEMSEPPQAFAPAFEAPPVAPEPPQASPSIPMPRPVPPSPPPSAVPTPQAQPPYRAPEPPAMPPPAPPVQPMGHQPSGDVGPALRAFCEGAGLDPKSVRPDQAVQLMHMLGKCVRVATEESMHMLKARADVKNFTRGGVRTMLSATANNPMKFMPDSQQALELMFVAPRDGFMTGADAFKDAMGDIRQHNEAVFRALQPALAEVFRGLSPEEIEAACESTGSNLLGKRSGRQWPTYVERWDQKAQAGEHGILDAFLQAFARAYAEANKG